jgi:hypothetical protein
MSTKDIKETMVSTVEAVFQKCFENCGGEYE